VDRARDRGGVAADFGASVITATTTSSVDAMVVMPEYRVSLSRDLRAIGEISTPGLFGHYAKVSATPGPLR
jgi:hypothetical protein